jgi:hypothetical protein
MSCTYRNGILKIEIAKGDNRKTVTMKLCLVRGELDRARLPQNVEADYFFICHKTGDYTVSRKYVVDRKIVDKSKLIPLGKGNRSALYDDIKKRLEDSPLGDFATVKKWKT